MAWWPLDKPLQPDPRSTFHSSKGQRQQTVTQMKVDEFVRAVNTTRHGQAAPGASGFSSMASTHSSAHTPGYGGVGVGMGMGMGAGMDPAGLNGGPSLGSAASFGKSVVSLPGGQSLPESVPRRPNAVAPLAPVPRKAASAASNRRRKKKEGGGGLGGVGSAGSYTSSGASKGPEVDGDGDGSDNDFVEPKPVVPKARKKKGSVVDLPGEGGAPTFDVNALGRPKPLGEEGAWEVVFAGADVGRGGLATGAQLLAVALSDTKSIREAVKVSKALQAVVAEPSLQQALSNLKSCVSDDGRDELTRAEWEEFCDAAKDLARWNDL